MAPRTQPRDDDRDARSDLRERAHEMRGEAENLARAGREAVRDLDTLARDQLERRPYLVLGALFAAGYVLGGGVPPRLMGFAFGVGTRVAASALAGQIATSVAPDEG